jgi:hypothetical protein
MIKKLILSICIFFALATFAQEGTSSPYSFYGIGDVKFGGTVENRSMGGLSIFRDSTHLNIQNPASYSGLKLTSFALGANSNKTKLLSGDTEEKAKRTTLDYLAVGLPLGKFGASFGLMPYSSVGYKIREVSYISSIASKRYSGTGGVNKVFVGFGYNFNPSLSFGVNMDYNFGKITTENAQFTEDIQFGSKEVNVSTINGLNFTAGLMFQTKLKGKLQFFSAMTFSPESKMNLGNAREISTFQLSNGSETIVDYTDIVIPKTTIKLPSKFTFGLGLGEVRKWQVGTEVVLQSSSNLTNRFSDVLPNVTFENSSKFIVGGFYIPKYNSFTSYFQRVVYRGGFNYQNTGLVINSKSIKTQSISLGVGLPLGGTLSNLNIGFEFGKRGTRMAGLIQENFTNLSIGISFNDKWFNKRKYD